MHQALETAIRELLRPVYVRDVPINCLGRLLRQEEDRLPPAANAFSGAGTAVPDVLFADSSRFEAFYDALCHLGQGSFACGMDAVIEMTQSLKEGEHHG